MSVFHMKVAGVTHEGREAIIRKLQPGESLYFKPEPTNPYDNHAVRIFTSDGRCIGFIPKEHNYQIFENLIHNKGQYVVRVSAITGGGFDSHYGCNMEIEYQPGVVNINCKVCGKKIERQVQKCPFCGHVISNDALPDLIEQVMSNRVFGVDKAEMMLDIGYAFEHGQTVNVDLISAAFWYEKVAKDHGEASEFINNVRRQLTDQRMRKEYVTPIGVTIRVGADIILGRYPYTESGEIRELHWTVLEINDDKALVITRDCIDHKVFNESRETPANWATSSLRKWLNSDFVHIAFDEEERSCIEEAVLVSMIDKIKDYELVMTSDKVFVLSERETSGYCFTEQTRFGKATEYAKSQGADYDILEGRGWWWLRDTTDLSGQNFGQGTSCVWFKGRIAMDSPDNEDASIRPAMWINLSKYDSVYER